MSIETFLVELKAIQIIFEPSNYTAVVYNITMDTLDKFRERHYILGTLMKSGGT